LYVRDWKHKLKADPTEWLLELEGSPVRYWTLVDKSFGSLGFDKGYKSPDS
jgi:hypothetical protein